MAKTIQISPLTANTFTPFGDILDASGTPDIMINLGLCGRYNDRAKLDFGEAGRAGISIFKSQVRVLPLKIEMVERHPDSSQAFVPMSHDAFLVVVAPDENGTPGTPLAFLTAPGQAINIHRNTWHGVLTPLAEPGLFAVIDRIGNTPNLEEFWYPTHYIVDF